MRNIGSTVVFPPPHKRLFRSSTFLSAPLQNGSNERSTSQSNTINWFKNSLQLKITRLDIRSDGWRSRLKFRMHLEMRKSFFCPHFQATQSASTQEICRRYPGCRRSVDNSPPHYFDCFQPIFWGNKIQSTILFIFVIYSLFHRNILVTSQMTVPSMKLPFKVSGLTVSKLWFK